MTTIPYCLIKPDVADALRTLVDALKLKVPGGDLGFLCPACEEPVQPYGGTHFQHLKENPKCRLTPK